MKIYTLNINTITDKKYQYGYSLLSAEKRALINRKKHYSDKLRSVAGELLAKESISSELNLNIKDINFAYNSKGKPYAPDVNISFSISHSNDLIVCATSSKEVGIDVEKIRPLDLSVTKKACTENELQYIFGAIPKDTQFDKCTDTQLLQKFFEVWTCKEAYFKCLGTGITNLKSIDTTTLNDNKTLQITENYVITTIIL